MSRVPPPEPKPRHRTHTNRARDLPPSPRLAQGRRTSLHRGPCTGSNGPDNRIPSEAEHPSAEYPSNPLIAISFGCRQSINRQPYLQIKPRSHWFRRAVKEPATGHRAKRPTISVGMSRVPPARRKPRHRGTARSRFDPPRPFHIRPLTLRVGVGTRARGSSEKARRKLNSPCDAIALG